MNNEVSLHNRWLSFLSKVALLFDEKQYPCAAKHMHGTDFFVMDPSKHFRF